MAAKVSPQNSTELVTVLRVLNVALPQLSVAVGASKSHSVPHSTVLSATQEIIGALVSATVTV